MLALSTWLYFLTSIIYRTLNRGELLPIQVFLNILFHKEEVNLIYNAKQSIVYSKNYTKVTNKHSVKTNQAATQKASKGKKATNKRDMSGFGCKDTLISGTQASSQ